MGGELGERRKREGKEGREGEERGEAGLKLWLKLIKVSLGLQTVLFWLSEVSFEVEPDAPIFYTLTQAPIDKAMLLLTSVPAPKQVLFWDSNQNFYRSQQNESLIL